MHNPVLVQGIGVAALLIAISIFQANTRKTMLLLGMCACFLWSTHFFLLGAATGAAINFVGTLRYYVFYRIKPSKKNRWILAIFMGLMMAVTAFTWQGVISLLPLLGSSSSLIACWQKKPKLIRRFELFTSPPWFTYNVITGSYPGIAIEILMVTSNLVGQYRFDFKSAPRSKFLRTSRASRSA